MKAFSLIELMVVVAIIGVLSVVAVPAYSNYIANVKYSTAINTTSFYLSKVLEYYSLHGTYPTSVASLGLTPAADPLNTEQPTSLSEYVVQPYVAHLNLSSIATIGSCPGFSIGTSSSNFGDGDIYTNGGPPGHQLITTYVIYDVNGMSNVICYYQLINIVTGAEHPNLPGCLDILDPTQSAEYSARISSITAQCT